MITPPERSPARDAAIEAMLPLVPTLGWSRPALTQAAGPDAALLFPGGPAAMVEAYIDLADRRMAEAPITEPRLSRRVRAVLETRFLQAAPHKAAIRRAAAILTLPENALLATRCTARTVDTIWHAAGDTSADFSWYTKRALLAGIYTATLFYWLNDSATQANTMEFLDRRLAGVAKIGKLRARFSRKAA